MYALGQYIDQAVPYYESWFHCSFERFLVPILLRLMPADILTRFIEIREINGHWQQWEIINLTFIWQYLIDNRSQNYSGLE